MGYSWQSLSPLRHRVRLLIAMAAGMTIVRRTDYVDELTVLLACHTRHAVDGSNRLLLIKRIRGKTGSQDEVSTMVIVLGGK